LVNKQGEIIYDSRSLHYYVTHVQTEENIAKFLSYDKAKDYVLSLKDATNWKIVSDWVIVKG